jgi:hypothetical protein
LNLLTGSMGPIPSIVIPKPFLSSHFLYRQATF